MIAARMHATVVCSRMLTPVETVCAVHHTLGRSISAADTSGICDFEPPEWLGLNRVKRMRLMIVTTLQEDCGEPTFREMRTPEGISISVGNPIVTRIPSDGSGSDFGADR